MRELTCDHCGTTVEEDKAQKTALRHAASTLASTPPKEVRDLEQLRWDLTDKQIELLGHAHGRNYKYRCLLCRNPINVDDECCGFDPCDCGDQEAVIES